MAQRPLGINKGWKLWVFKKGEKILSRDFPLVAKEAAWKAVKFASECGKSNPVSFALRPVAAHEKFRTAVGINLAIIAILATVFLPTISMAENLDAWQSITIASDGGAILETKAGIQVPIKNYTISQKYWFLHSGIDLASQTGESIRPVMPGKVIMAEYNWFGYGNCIIVRHASGYESLYGHLSKIMVKNGQDVSMDTILGLVGSTGHSTGPHLHLEIHEEGKGINPGPILGI